MEDLRTFGIAQPYPRFKLFAAICYFENNRTKQTIKSLTIGDTTNKAQSAYNCKVKYHFHKTWYTNYAMSENAPTTLFCLDEWKHQKDTKYDYICFIN